MLSEGSHINSFCVASNSSPAGTLFGAAPTNNTASFGATASNNSAAGTLFGGSAANASSGKRKRNAVELFI